jgi:hypothetical protein
VSLSVHKDTASWSNITLCEVTNHYFAIVSLEKTYPVWLLCQFVNLPEVKSLVMPKFKF